MSYASPSNPLITVTDSINYSLLLEMTSSWPVTSGLTMHFIITTEYARMPWLETISQLFIKSGVCVVGATFGPTL